MRGLLPLGGALLVKFALFFQFGDLLDENADLAFDTTGINAMANKDKASK